jgi:hypothetical protein
MATTKFGSLNNQLMSNSKSPEPTVGMGVTQLCWTDRHAWTVIEVKSARKLVIQADKATRTDKHGMSESQNYEFERDPNGSKCTITLRKDGRWRAAGESMAGAVYALGYRAEYHDYSF